MRTILSLFVLLVATVLACGQAAAQGWKPEVDPSKVTSFKDFQTLDMASFALYKERDDESHKKHVANDDRVFVEYLKIRRAALEELRSLDRDHYLEWLDAREIEDHEKVRVLQSTIPALAAYEQKRSAAYKVYQTKKDASYKEYAALKDAAYKVYQEESRLLRKAYQALPPE